VAVGPPAAAAELAEGTGEAGADAGGGAIAIPPSATAVASADWVMRSADSQSAESHPIAEQTPLAPSKQVARTPPDADMPTQRAPALVPFASNQAAASSSVPCEIAHKSAVNQLLQKRKINFATYCEEVFTGGSNAPFVCYVYESGTQRQKLLGSSQGTLCLNKKASKDAAYRVVYQTLSADAPEGGHPLLQTPKELSPAAAALSA